MAVDDEELRVRFTYHRPTPEQAGLYTALRAGARAFAEMIVEAVPESREQSLALTYLEQTVMWANAGIARRTQSLPDADDGDPGVDGDPEPPF